MPLPTVKPGENQGVFISRCVANEAMMREFPDKKQRLAVCYSQFRKKKKGKTYREESKG